MLLYHHDSVFKDEEEEEVPEYDEDDIVAASPLDHLLGSSHMSAVSGILSKRRVSTASALQKRYRKTTAGSQISSGAATNPVGQNLTTAERVETGRVRVACSWRVKILF